ncbi:MAG: endonuclease III [Gemmatimonadaceae bacterium]|nr:endonuclease III [Gemmatimonadaceae bacterium]
MPSRRAHANAEVSLKAPDRSPARTRRATPRARTRKVNPTPELAAEYYRRLRRAYPDAKCALNHRNAFELLVATILSAQCTDARVNMVTPALFAAYPDARALADADPADVEQHIKSTGFFRSKTKSLIGMARALVERHGGDVPASMDALTKLPGVGRKTANVILGNAFGRNEGIVVDTHVTRLANRLGLTTQHDPVKIESDLMALFPKRQWTMLSHLLIEHGRRVCIARTPKCPDCPLADLCPSSTV